MIGQNLAHYRVLEKLGAGGMGEVYRAQDEKLGRNVAIKILPADSSGNSTARLRLMREARAAAALNHPHICVVHEVGESDSQAYIAMELVDGVPLSERLRAHGRLTPAQVVRYGVQIADGLAHAHQRGILHRDLKCSNVVIASEDRAKILDFGLAKRFVSDSIAEASTLSQELTEEGAIVGTFPYLAPEQLNGEAADARTDIWGLGVMLYEMAAGDRPFRGRTRFELSSAILTSRPPALPASVPSELQAVILRCLEKEPARRYQQAGEVRAALEAVASGSVARVAPPSRASKTMLAGLFAALAVAAIVVVGRDIITSPSSTGAAPTKSIAVLPAITLSGGPDDQLFADGIHNGLLGELGRIGDVRVISRTSAMKYRDTKKSMPEIARELGVNHIAELSVAPAGDKTRLQLHLIEALPSERQLWTQSYERDDAEVLSLMRDGARGLASALGVRVTTSGDAPRSVDRESYELYLRGMHQINTFTQDGYRKGIVFLHQAVERDPADAGAWAALGVGYALIAHGGGQDGGREGFAKARAAAEQALKLDETNAEAHGVMAEVKAYYEWDWEGARREYERALELNPNADEVHRHYAWLHALHWRFEDADREIAIAQEISPLRFVHLAERGWLRLYAGDDDGAIEFAKKALEINPNARNALMVLGSAYASKGMFDEAVAAHKLLIEKHPPAKAALAITYARAGRKDEARALVKQMIDEPALPGRNWRIPRVYAALGQLDEAFRFAEIGFKEKHWSFPWIFHEARYEGIREDPRYHDLMRRLNLPLPPR